MRCGACLPRAPKPVTNADLARLLDARADELGAEGANVYRIRAYRRAARAVEAFPHEVVHLLKQGADLRQIPAVGADLAAKLRDMVASGGAPIQASSRKVEDKDRLREQRQKTRASRGAMPENVRRIRPLVATVAERIRQALADAPGITRAELAGSYRRRSDTIGDLDLLVAGDLAAARKALEQHPEVAAVITQTDDLLSLRLTKGMRVDVRACEPVAFGAAWLLGTGSMRHAEHLVAHATTQGIRWTPNGLAKGRKRLPSASEEGAFASLGLQPIAPELREGNGEVKAAAADELPDLVTAADVRGDLHTHTTDSDGAHSLEVMARAAAKRGLTYLAVTDHTSRTAIAGGMKWPGFQRQHRLVDQLNAKFDDEGLEVTILKGAEVDILKDGRLDLEPKHLDQLDVVVASLHFRERQSGKEHTERVLAAMATGHAHILGHPSGRLIGRRPPMEHDWTRLMDAAADQGWAFEIDGSPWRQDVWSDLVLQGKRKGVRFAADSDAHSTHELAYQQNAVDQARRGWLEAKDVLNTLTVKQLRKRLSAT